MDAINYEELSRCFFTESNDALFIFDSDDHQIVDANRTAERLTGKPREQLLEMKLPELLRVDDGPIVNELLRNFQSTGELQQQDTCCLKINESKFLEVNISIYRLGTAAKPFGCMAARDISQYIRSEEALQVANEQLRSEIDERNAAEKSLYAHQRRLQLSLDATRTSCWEVNLKTGELISQRPTVTWLGYEPEEIPSSRNWWKSLIHPDDVDIPKKALQDHLEGRAPTYECEYRVRGKSGQWYWTLDRGIVVQHDEDGKPLLIVGSDTDITERKRAEEKLRASEARSRTLLQGSPVCIKIIDLDSRLQYMSAAGREQLKIADIEPFYGCKFPPDLYLEPWRKLANEHLERAKLGEVSSVECCVRDTLGNDLWYDTTFVPARDKEARVASVIVTSVNITNRKQLEIEAREHRARLAHVARLSTMGEMATWLAHELNQPLAAISNYCHAGKLALADVAETNPETLQELFGKLSDQVTRTGEIIRRLRGFVSQRTAAPSLVNVDEPIQEVLRLFESDLRQNEVTVEFQAIHSNCLAVMDEIQIQQVLVNLIRNALDAMSKSGPDQRILKITTSKTSDNLIEVAVSDTGKGIPADSSDAIFDAFFSTKPQGMGMGLAISRTIVESHGGRLWMAPNPDCGVTFHLTLPIANAETDDDSA